MAAKKAKASLTQTTRTKTSLAKRLLAKTTLAKTTLAKTTLAKTTLAKTMLAKTTLAKKVARRPTSQRAAKAKPTSGAAAKKPRIYAMSFASVYPLYVQKAEKKGRTRQEVDAVIFWLTGYDAKALDRVLATKLDFESFFAEAPRMNPNVGLIQGVVCGVRVEDVAEPLMQKIRYLDKLIDELARGKKLESVLRQG